MLPTPKHGWNNNIWLEYMPPTSATRLTYLPDHPTKAGEHCRQNAEKTPELYCRILMTMTKPKAKILDLFSGTFASMIAAVRCGRTMIGVESENDVYQAAKHRVSRILRYVWGF